MKLTAKEKVSYGLGAVGKDMVYMLSASYILYYYQDILGVNAFAMGIILMAARVFDAFNDPIMGVLVAKTRTKWGKFRPVADGRNRAQCDRALFYVCGTACIRRGRAGGLCSSHLYSVGCDLHDDGYPVLVNDPCIYRGRQRA